MMGYLISEMLPCLLLAGLIGMILGWLLRKCKKRDISYEEVSSKAVIKKAATPTLKAQGLVSNIDAKRELLEDEIVQLRLKLSSAELAAKTTDMKLSAIESDYDLKLKKAQESFYGRDDVIQSLELKLKDAEKKTFEIDTKYALLDREHESKLTKIANLSKEGDHKLESLKDELAKAEASSKSFENTLKDVRGQLTRVEQMNTTLQEEKASFEKRYEVMQEEYNSKLKEVANNSYDNEQEMKALKSALEDAKSHEKKLKNIQITAEKEVQSLHDKLRKVEAEAARYKADNISFENKISSFKSQIDNEKVDAAKRFSIMQSEYDTKLNQVTQSTKESDGELQSLRDKLRHLESQVTEYKAEKSSLESQLSQAKKADEEVLRLKRALDDEKESATQKYSLMQSEYDTKLNRVTQSTKESDGELQSLRDKLRHVESEATSFKNEKVLLEDEIAYLKSSHEDAKKLKSDFEEEKDTLTKKLSIMERDYDFKLEKISGEAKEKEQSLQTLKSQYEGVKDTTKEIDTLKGELKSAKLTIIASKVKFSKIESDYQEELKGAHGDSERLREELDALQLKLNQSSIKTSIGSTKKPSFLKKPHGKADNLQLIKGVGGKLNGVLNDLGVYHFSQIAAWNEEEVAWVNEHLAFTGRIEREEWIAQAKALMSGEETEFSSRVKAGEVSTSSHKEESHEDATMLRPEFLIQARSEGADNLQLIQAIGGKLGGELNDLGVFHYDQIAAWDEKEVAWMNQKLSLNGKIEKEDWRTQAKTLMRGGIKIETKKPEFLKAAKGGKADNLQLIKGVGGKLNGVLNDLGVYHFSQIAAWNEEEVAWVNEHLAFTGRIEREEWIAQAKALMSGEETEFSKRVQAGAVPTSTATEKEPLKRHKHTKRLKKK